MSHLIKNQDVPGQRNERGYGLACVAGAKKGTGRGIGRKVGKGGKGKGAPATRDGVFVFRPPFSELIR